MLSHYINKLLNLEDVLIKNIIPGDHTVTIHIETKPSPHTCPNCGQMTSRIRTSYGFRNFDRFRTRILHCTR